MRNWPDIRMALVERLRQNGAILKRDTYALSLAVRDPRTWYATVVGATVVAYLLSPLDLIPDSIPVVAYLDELIIVPAGIVLVLRLLPDELVACWRDQARTKLERPTSWVGAAVMIGLWLALVLSLTMVVSKVSD
jgi:uncharacterized membrane protein YkvA (DUF1232 family)